MHQYRNIEFYNTPDGEVSIKEEGKASYPLTEESRGIIEYILGIIRDRYPESYDALMSLYSKSTKNKIYFEFRVVRRFIRCNFGEYDQQNNDIDSGGNFKFEEVKCPLRGECPLEGIVCKPKLKTKISDREMEVYRLIVEGKNSNEIAEELFISPSTVDRHRENIKSRIGVKNTQQMTTYWYEHGLE